MKQSTIVGLGLMVVGVSIGIIVRFLFYQSTLNSLLMSEAILGIGGLIFLVGLIIVLIKIFQWVKKGAHRKLKSI